MKRYLAAAMLLLALSGCGSSGSSAQLYTTTEDFFAMDTYMEFTAYGKNSEKAVDAAIEEVQKLDAMLSAENSKSEVYALNEQGNLQATDDLAELILRGKEIYQETDGLFDDTIYPVMKLWGFPTGNYNVPTAAEVQKKTGTGGWK